MALADSDDLSGQKKIIGKIPLTKAGITQNIYRQIDILVPELKKKSINGIINLECHYNGNTEREQDVLKAYMIAGKIEKYLRERYKLKLDLWLSTRVKQIPNGKPIYLTFYALSENIKLLDKADVSGNVNAK